MTPPDVPARCDHTPCPTGYAEWHAWADKIAETHQQERCPVCGLWAVWRPLREDESPGMYVCNHPEAHDA